MTPLHQGIGGGRGGFTTSEGGGPEPTAQGGLEWGGKRADSSGSSLDLSRYLARSTFTFFFFFLPRVEVVA